MIFLAVLCASYLVGAIPTGLLVGRLKGVDIRRQGSGNVGATNVARVVGKLPGAFVLLVDVAKGWAPVVFFAPFVIRAGSSISPETVRLLIGMAAVAGHIWNPFLQWKGGRGVATSLGLLLGLDARVALVSLLIWIGVMLATRYVSVASISAAFSSPFLLALFGAPTSWVLGGIGVALGIIARHRPNILRLLQGEEHRFGSPPKSPSA